MTDPVLNPLKVHILKKIVTMIEVVTITNGYHHDLPGKVFVGRNTFGDDDGDLLVSLLEPEKEPETLLQPIETEGTAAINSWELLIQGFAPDDPIDPTIPAYRLLADVKRAIIQGVKTDHVLGFKEITKLLLGGGLVRPPDGVVSDKAFFWLPMKLELVEDDDAPFS